jgi:hypothetical protein
MSEQPEAEPETMDADAMMELALEKAKELVEEGDEFTKQMRARAMACKELGALAQARSTLAEYASGDHIDAIDEAIIRVCATMGEAA